MKSIEEMREWLKEEIAWRVGHKTEKAKRDIGMMQAILAALEEKIDPRISKIETFLATREKPEEIKIASMSPGEQKAALAERTEEEGGVSEGEKLELIGTLRILYTVTTNYVKVHESDRLNYEKIRALIQGNPAPGEEEK